MMLDRAVGDQHLVDAVSLYIAALQHLELHHQACQVASDAFLRLGYRIPTKLIVPKALGHYFFWLVTNKKLYRGKIMKKKCQDSLIIKVGLLIDASGPSFYLTQPSLLLYFSY